MLALLHPRALQEVQTNSTEHAFTFAAKLRLHVQATRLHTDKMVRPKLAISYSPWPDGDRATAHRGEELFRPEAIDTLLGGAFNRIRKKLQTTVIATFLVIYGVISA